MNNFNEMLERNSKEVERPPIPPQGTYNMVVQGPGQTSERGGFSIVEFTLKGQEALEDVDEEQLAEFGAVGSVIARQSFLFPEDDEAGQEQALFRLKTFLVDHLGMEDDHMKKMIAEAAGHPVQANIVHKQDKNDPKIYHANVKNTAPIGQ